MESMKQYVNDENFWDSFTEMLNEKLVKEKEKLEQVARFFSGEQKELVELYRTQGRIYALNNLLKLKAEIRSKDRSKAYMQGE